MWTHTSNQLYTREYECESHPIHLPSGRGRDDMGLSKGPMQPKEDSLAADSVDATYIMAALSPNFRHSKTTVNSWIVARSVTGRRARGHVGSVDRRSSRLGTSRLYTISNRTRS